MKRLLFTSALLASAIAANAALYYRPETVMETPQGVVQADIGPRRLSVPRALMRDPAQMSGGRLDRLDLVLGIEHLGPLPAPNAKSPEAAPPERLAIVVTPAENGLSSIDMFGKVYARFLAADTRPSPTGLMLRRFRDNTPYQDRELYLGVGTGRTFVALCPLPEAREQEPCTTSFRLAGLDMELRFNARHLNQWRRFTEGAFALMERMVADEQPDRERIPLPPED